MPPSAVETIDTAPAAIALPRTARRLATFALMLASGMQAADATIANVALPQLEEDLGSGVVLGAWVVTSYLCATAIVAPLTGWLRRRFGTGWLFTGAVAAFAAASLLCSLAPSAGAIILFRILQGAAGGVIHPLAQAILLDLYPREQHGRMLAAWGATIMVGPIVGPALGGIITDLASWRFVFAVNLPLAALAILAMRAALPRTPVNREASIDMLGVALLAIAIGGLQLFLARAIDRSWLDSPELLLEALSAAIAFAALLARTQRTAATAFRPAVFADVNFAVAAFYNFLMSALLFVIVVFLPALSQGPLDYSATLAGLAIVPRGGAMMLMMLAAGHLVERVDGRILLGIGFGLMALGLWLLSAVRPPDSLALIVIGSTLQAAGGGMLITCLSTIGFSTLPPELRTDAAGVYSLLRQLGCASGVALMTAVLHSRIESNLATLNNALDTASTATQPQFVELATLQAYTTCFQAMAFAALAAMPAILLFRVRSLGRSASEPA